MKAAVAALLVALLMAGAATAAPRPGGAALNPHCVPTNAEADDGEGDDAPASEASSQEAGDPAFIALGSGDEEAEGGSEGASSSSSDPLETSQLVTRSLNGNKCGKGGAVVVVSNRNHLTHNVNENGSGSGSASGSASTTAGSDTSASGPGGSMSESASGSD